MGLQTNGSVGKSPFPVKHAKTSTGKIPGLNGVYCRILQCPQGTLTARCPYAQYVEMERLPGAVSDAEWNYYSGLRFLPPTVWWPADVPSELRLLEDRRWWATTMFEEFAGETLLSFAKRANLQLNLPEAKRNPTRKVLKKTSQVVNLCTWHTEWDFSGYSRLNKLLPDGKIHFGGLRWLDHFHSLRSLCKTGRHLPDTTATAYSLVSAIYLLLGPRISFELFPDRWFPSLTAPVEVLWENRLLNSERLRDKRHRPTPLGHNGIYNA
jgi:hypothetical protein